MVSMGGLIKNEFLKLLRKRKFIIVLIVLSVLTFLSAFITWYGIKQEKPQNMIKNYQSYVDNQKSRLNNENDLSNDEKKEINNNITKYEAMIEQAKLDLKGNKDWKQAVKDKIDLLKEQKEQPDVSTDNSQLEPINSQIKQQQYYIDNNVKPEEAGTFNALSGLQYIIYFIDMLFLAVIIASFTGDIVSGECTPPTMKILLTKPVSRAKILLSKFITAILTAVGTVAGVELAAFLIMGIIFGFGSFSQPTGIGTKYVYDSGKIALSGKGVKMVLGSTMIISVGKLIVLMLLLQILFAITCAAFSFMISVITKSSAASLIISILSIVVMFIATSIITSLGSSPAWLCKALSFLFTSYNDTASILGGKLAEKFSFTALTPGFAVGVMAGWIIVCYAISHLVFTKRDMLI